MNTSNTHDRNGVELRPGDAVTIHPEQIAAVVRVIESPTTVTVEDADGHLLRDVPAADLALVEASG